MEPIVVIKIKRFQFLTKYIKKIPCAGYMAVWKINSKLEYLKF